MLQNLPWRLGNTPYPLLLYVAPNTPCAGPVLVSVVGTSTALFLLPLPGSRLAHPALSTVDPAQVLRAPAIRSKALDRVKYRGIAALTVSALVLRTLVNEMSERGTRVED